MTTGVSKVILQLQGHKPELRIVKEKNKEKSLGPDTHRHTSKQ